MHEDDLQRFQFLQLGSKHLSNRQRDHGGSESLIRPYWIFVFWLFFLGGWRKNPKVAEILVGEVEVVQDVLLGICGSCTSSRVVMFEKRREIQNHEYLN